MASKTAAKSALKGTVCRKGKTKVKRESAVSHISFPWNVLNIPAVLSDCFIKISPSVSQKVADVLGILVFFFMAASAAVFVGLRYELSIEVFVIILFAMAVAAALMFIRILQREPEVLTVGDDQPGEMACLSPVATHTSLPQQAAGRLRKQLEEIRTKAFEWIRARYPRWKIHLDDLRGNVFLATSDDPTSRSVSDLRMSRDLFVGKAWDGELDLHFAPGEGLTGHVFATNEPASASDGTSSRGQASWQDIRHLTKEKKAAICPDLRWIVSRPLWIAEGNGQRAGGVLNIDGLRYRLSDKELHALNNELADPVQEFANEFAKVLKNPRRGGPQDAVEMEPVTVG